MSARLRSAVLLSLLAVFFFNVCVFGLVLTAQLHLHQQSQHSRSKTKKHKEIVELRIDRKLVETTNAQFQWKEEHEFCWNGEMYDVEESFLEEDVWVFIAEHDSKEDHIRKQLDTENGEHKAKKRNTPSKKNSKSGPEYFEQPVIAVHIHHPALHQNKEGEAELMFAHNALPDPPPWVLL